MSLKVLLSDNDRTSTKSILLADSTKFDKTAFTKTCDLAQIDTIVTDKEPNIEWFDYIKENDIKLIY